MRVVGTTNLPCNCLRCLIFRLGILIFIQPELLLYKLGLHRLMNAFAGSLEGMVHTRIIPLNAFIHQFELWVLNRYTSIFDEFGLCENHLLLLLHFIRILHTLWITFSLCYTDMLVDIWQSSLLLFGMIGLKYCVFSVSKVMFNFLMVHVYTFLVLVKFFWI